MSAPVRSLAFSALMRVERSLGGGRVRLVPPEPMPESPLRANRVVDDLISENSLDGRDAALLAEFVYGCLRHRITLERIARAHLRSSRKGRLEDQVRLALWLGVYQLVFLDRVPEFAAVGETVAVLDRPGRRGLVNAVLRAVASSCGTRHRGPKRPGKIPRDRLVPIHGGRWLEMARTVFPSYRRTRTAHLAACHSHPEALVGCWLERYGLEVTEELLLADNEPPPFFLRANTLRTSRDQLLERLEAEGVKARPGELPESLIADTPGRLDRLASFREGLFVVQDETAMAVARLLDPKPGERILDLCAAPGGKTTHLAALADDKASVVATDVSSRRLRLLEDTMKRLGLSSVKPVLIQPVGAADGGEADDDSDGDPNSRAVPLADVGADFDCVLVDVPCSNSGVFRRRVEARWRQPTAAARESLLALQAALLEAGADKLRPGGRLVYSTCAVDPDENGKLVRSVLERRSDLSLDQEHSALPKIGAGDGGYAAKLIKSS